MPVSLSRDWEISVAHWFLGDPQHEIIRLTGLHMRIKEMGWGSYQCLAALARTVFIGSACSVHSATLIH